MNSSFNNVLKIILYKSFIYWTEDLNLLLNIDFLSIIIMSNRLLRFPWFSLAIHFYRPSLPTSPLDYTLYLHRAVVDKFQLVIQHLLVCVKGSIRERHMSLSLLFWQCPAYLVSLIWLVLGMGGRWLYSYYFVWRCFQDLLNITRSIFV